MRLFLAVDKYTLVSSYISRNVCVGLSQYLVNKLQCVHGGTCQPVQQCRSLIVILELCGTEDISESGNTHNTARFHFSLDLLTQRKMSNNTRLNRNKCRYVCVRHAE